MVYFLLAVAIVRGLLFGTGTVGLHWDWTFPPYADQFVSKAERSLSAWDYWAGGQIGIATGFPHDWLLGGMALLGLNGDWISKIFLVAVVFLSGRGMHTLAKESGVIDIAQFASGAIYAVSPVLFNQTVIGHQTYIFAYAVAPLGLAYFLRATKEPGVLNRHLAVSGLLISLTTVHGQFALIISGMLILMILYPLRKGKRRLVLVSTILIGLALLATNLFWILPVLAGGSLLPSRAFGAQLVSLEAIAPGMLDSFGLVGYAASNFAYESTFAALGIDQPGVRLATTAVPIISFFALILATRRRESIYFSAIALVAVFFIKGDNPPLGEYFLAAFETVPLLKAFRDTYTLSFALSMSYAVLAGLTAPALVGRLSSIFRRLAIPSYARTGHGLGASRFASVVIVSAILLLYATPAVTGDFGGQVQTYDLGPDNLRAYDFFESIPGDYRIAWLPATRVIVSSHSKLYQSNDPMVSFSPKPALDANANFWNPFVAFVQAALEGNKTRRIADLLALLNANYVVTREDARAISIPNSRNSGLPQGQLGLSQIAQFGGITAFENERRLNRIYGSNNLTLVSGDYSTLITLDYLSPWGDNAPSFLFPAQLDGISESQAETLYGFASTVVLKDNDYLDLVWPFLSEGSKLDPWRFAQHRSPERGWTYVGYTWGSQWSYTTEIGGAAVTSVAGTLRIPFVSSANDDFIILARLYSADPEAGLTVMVDDRPLSQNYPLRVPTEGFAWTALGESTIAAGSHEIVLHSMGGAISAGRMLIVRASELESAFSHVARLIKDKSVTLISKDIQELSGENLQVAHPGAIVSENKSYSIASPTAGIRLNVFAPIGGKYDLRARAQMIQSDPIDTLTNASNWHNTGLGDAAISVSPGPGTNLPCLVYSLRVNKSQPSSSSYILEQSEIAFDLSSFDKIGFWIYPQTTSKDVHLLFVLRNGLDDWKSFSYYAESNRWDFVTFDLTGWQRDNVSVIRLAQLGSAWAPYVDGQLVTLYFSNLLARNTSKSNSFETVRISELNLSIGPQSVFVNLLEDVGQIDFFVLQKTATSATVQRPPSVEYLRHGPTDYAVVLQTSSALVLVLSENYSPGWIGKVEDDSLVKFEVNGFANGFFLPESGMSNVRILYSLQPYYSLGLYVSWFAYFSLAGAALLGALNRHARKGQRDKKTHSLPWFNRTGASSHRKHKNASFMTTSP